MARYDYQYETSPRKLEPEYRKVKKQPKKNIQKQKQSKKVKVKSKARKKRKMSFEVKFFLNSMLFFAIIFAMIACQALVKQQYKEKENLKKEYNKLLANSMVSNEVNDDTRKLASEYGMQTKSATLIDLGITDYIETSIDEAQVQESFWDKIVNWFKEIF